MATNTQGPQFTPRKNGTVWIDPKTGESWEYTKNAWQRLEGETADNRTTNKMVASGKLPSSRAEIFPQESESIQEDVKAKGTFEINPDEEPFVKALREGGSNQDQINLAISQRRNIKGNLGANNTQGADESTTSNYSNPFEGKSKKAVLLDAFNKGVRDTTELEKIESLYDKLVGEEETDVPEDISILSYEEQRNVREKVKLQVAEKARALSTMGEREGMVAALATMENGQDLIDMMEIDGVKTGLVGGLWNKVERVFGRTSAEEDSMAAAISVFRTNYLKAQSGLAITENEAKELAPALPSETKTPQQNILGMIQISRYLSQKGSLMVGADLSPLIPQSGNNDPLGLNSSKRSKENPLGI